MSVKNVYESLRPGKLWVELDEQTRELLSEIYEAARLCEGCCDGVAEYCEDCASASHWAL